MKKTNIKIKLSRVRDKFTSGDELLQEIKDILKEDQSLENEIRTEIHHGSNSGFHNSFDLDLLETDRIYHEDQIRQICKIYRLRFLDSKYFKDQLPYEAIMKVKTLQKQHQTTLKGFKIMAPAKAFKLKNADDPLFFAPIGNGYYYLIHKWGNDLSFFRKLLVWPLRGIENMAIFIFLLSMIFTALVPARFINAEMTAPKFLLFSFMMAQWFGGLTLFFMIKKGKNFSPTVWKSTFINA